MPTYPRAAELAAALARDGRPRYVLAAEARVTPTVLAALIAGRARPNAGHRDRLAALLGVSAEQLFPELAEAGLLDEEGDHVGAA